MYKQATRDSVSRRVQRCREDIPDPPAASHRRLLNNVCNLPHRCHVSSNESANTCGAARREAMSFLLVVIAWCLLFVVAWPLALLAIFLLPLLWLLSLPFRALGVVIEALFAFIK